MSKNLCGYLCFQAKEFQSLPKDGHLNDSFESVYIYFTLKCSPYRSLTTVLIDFKICLLNVYLVSFTFGFISILGLKLVITDK